MEVSNKSKVIIGANGPSAKQLAINAGLLPANASDADFVTLITGKPGKDSQVPGPSAYELAKAAGFPGDLNAWLVSLKSTTAGPSNYALAVANGFSGSVSDYLASLKGADGVSAIPGLLASGTTLTPGNLVFFHPILQQWTNAKLVSHELLLGSLGMVDRLGNIIAPGNAVDLTGLGFTAGTSYYLEARDLTGRNLQPLPSPFPTGLLPSATRVYANVGTVTFLAGKQLLNFAPVIAPASGASSANFSGTDFTFLPYQTTPTSAQMKRTLDLPDNGGASINGLHTEGDSGIDSGYPVVPIKKLVNGVSKNVFLYDIGYNGFHVNGLAASAWTTPQMSFDVVTVIAANDGNQTGVGIAFGINAAGTDMYVVRLFGTTNVLVFQHVTISGGTVSATDLRGSVNVTGADKTPMCLRVNVSADGKTLSAKAWKMDLTKSVYQQGSAEPAGWAGTYTASTPFPAGLIQSVLGNGILRRYWLSKSNDASIPAQFDGDL